MRVFPNPATDEVNIEFVKAFAGNALIEVSDETGRIVITQKMVPAAKQAQLRTGNLAAGVYYVRVKGDDGIAVRKITVIGK
jgi:DNA-binding transcriptional regulator/RsmH inhibitor MraZ